MAETAESRYRQLEGTREPYLTRAIEAADLTIPSLIRREGHKDGKIKTPHQSVGSRGVNNLASKLLLALFPPNTSFFRFLPDASVLEEMSNEPEVKTEVERALAKIERQAMSKVEAMGARIQAFEAIKHLIVTGNILFYEGKESTKVFHLNQYVTKRTPSGEMLETIIREGVSPSALDPHIQELLDNDSGTKSGEEKTKYLFTHIKLVGDKHEVYQEIDGKLIPGSNGSYPADQSPWMPLRLIKIEGEDYGRGYIEEYYGDLQSLDRLSKAIVEGSAAAAKVLFLVNPNGTTRARVLQKAPNGAIREGDARDITVLRLDKAGDFRVALDMMSGIERRLEYAFMMNSSFQRKGERVTAEEIRYMAGELEDALGGIYSLLSQEFQMPFVKRLLAVMVAEGKMPPMPKGLVKPAIVTGMEALGRGHDLQKLDLLLGGLIETVGLEVLSQYLNVSDYIKRRATALGIDTDGLIKTPEQIQQEQQAQAQQMQQERMQQMVEKLGPKAMDMAGNAMSAQGA